MKKALIVAAAATTLAVTSVTGIGLAHAASATGQGNGSLSGLVEALATKFNLSQEQVQQVFDDQHKLAETERTVEVKSELAQLVTDGKLTQAQSDAILAKRAEVQAQHDGNRSSMSREERRTAMEKERTTLEAWAKNQGISTEYVNYVFGGRGKGGEGQMGNGGGRHGRNTTDQTEAASN